MEFPDLEKALWQRYKDRGLEVIGISGYSSSTKMIHRFLRQTRVTFPVASGFFSFGPRNRKKNSMGMHNFTTANDVRPDIAPFEVHGIEELTPFPFHLLVDRDGTILFASKTFDLDRVDALMKARASQ